MKPSASANTQVRTSGKAVGALLAFGLLAVVSCSSGSGGFTNQAVTPSEPITALTGAPATVVEVIDGDTVVVEMADRDERVRLVGIDTPEATGGFLPVECYGDEASVFTRSLLPPGTEVRLTRDAEARDRYDRLLAYLHRAGDGLFVNLEIAANGYAEALIIKPNTTHADAFYAAAATARDQGLGLWGACGSADVVLE